MTGLRKRMLEELQRRNYSSTTIRCYLRVVEDFARYFGKRPDHLTEEHIREYHLYLLQERKLTARTVGLHIAALRFFFVKTLRRPYLQIDLPYPKVPERIADGLEPGRSRAADRLCKESAGLRDADDLVCDRDAPCRVIRLKVEDIDSERMIVHIRQGKGNRDRDVPLTPKLLEDAAGVLAVDEAQDLFVSRHGQQLACRQAHHAQVRVVCGTRRREDGPASKSVYRRTRCGTAWPLTYWKMARISAPSRCCWGTPTWKPRRVYLHLSRRHLQAVVNPVETISISKLDTVKRSRRKQKP